MKALATEVRDSFRLLVRVLVRVGDLLYALVWKLPEHDGATRGALEGWRRLRSDLEGKGLTR